MDRNFIIKTCIGFYTKGDITYINTILYEYCLEHNKKPEDIQKFLTYIFSTMSWLPYFEEALVFYKRKFFICELWSNIHFNSLNQEQRKLLQIF